MNTQDKKPQMWKEKIVTKFIDQLFMAFAKRDQIPPSSRQRLAQKILGVLKDKNAPNSFQQKSYSSSYNSDIFRGSSKQQQFIMAHVMGQDIPCSNDNILIPQPSFSISKNSLDQIKIEEQNFNNQRLENISSIQQETQKHMGSDQANDDNECILKLEQNSFKSTKSAFKNASIKQKPRFANSSKFCHTLRQRKQRKVYLEDPSFIDNSKPVKKSKKSKKIKKIIKRPCSEVQNPQNLNDINNKKVVRQVSQRGRRPMDPKMEQLLVKWIINQQRMGRTVSQKMMRQKAKLMTFQKDFRASKGWLQKFLNRNRGKIYPTFTSHQMVTRHMIQDQQDDVKIDEELIKIQ